MPESEEIRFPVDWNYRIICLADQEALTLAAIAATLREHGCETPPTRGRDSAGGKYCAYHVTVTFADLNSMRTLSTRLGAIPGVKFLL